MATALLVTAICAVLALHSYGNIAFDVHPDSVMERVHAPKYVDEGIYKFNIRTEMGTHPAVKPLEDRYKASTSMSAKFRSLVPGTVDMWYDDGEGGSEQGHLSLGQETTTNSYEGHVFFFTTKGDKSKEVARVTMRPDQVLYLIEDPNNPAPAALREATYKEFNYMAEYLNRTGIQWRHYYGPNGPRPPPSHFMWPADHIGQVHSVYSPEGHWHCDGDRATCQSREPVPLELQVVSLRPRAFVINHFLNDYEINEILKLAGPRMSKSIVGDGESGSFESASRTSRNGWLGRTGSDIIQTLFVRAEHLLRIPRLDSRNTEDIQVVHYKDGQKYDSHHDWGVSGFPESRYLTLLLYLSDMDGPNAGGETAFPKGADGAGFKVSPRKGSAVLFYDLLEDGNGDDLALHAALPIWKGEKWLANFWVWDPTRHDLGESRAITNQEEDDPERMDVLVWHKLDTVGFQPSAREGHSAVTNGLSVLVFGGFEAGQRVNALISLEVTSCSWSVVATKGEVPCPRSYHAANRYRNLMLVHGGECKQERPRAHSQVVFELGDGQSTELSRSVSMAEETVGRSLVAAHSQSTSVINIPTLQERHAPAHMGHDGVTLGDSLCGTKLAGQIKISRGGGKETLGPSNTGPIGGAPSSTSAPASTGTTSAVATQTACLDDLHVLDTISMEWYKMKCILSPLPRKGHTLSMLPIQGTEHAVIFGGYSIENVTLSNSLHVCEADKIYEHYVAKRDLGHKNKQQAQGAQSTHVGVIKALKNDNTDPIMWRTLSTTGTPPTPRYRHSSTLIHSGDGTPLLVVMGGIGADATVALSDIYLLDLNSLHWTQPLTGNDALAEGIGGDGPITGLYGHVAFAVSAMGDPTSQEFELLVFGGSANPNSGQSNCNQSIFAFNMATHIWRRVPTGYAFPSARANHSAALVQGWAPLHDTPSAVIGGDGKATSSTHGIAAQNARAQQGSSNGICAVIFGGLDSIQCASDTWALDLKWRKSGVEQYDISVTNQEARILQQQHVGTSAVELSYLNTPGLLQKENNSSLRNLFDPNNTNNMLNATAMQDSSKFSSRRTLESPLQNFRKIAVDHSFDMMDGTVNPASDRNKKQGLNSRRYSDIAASTPTMTTKDATRTHKSIKTAKSSNVTDFRRSSSHSEADFTNVNATMNLDGTGNINATGLGSEPQSPYDGADGGGGHGSTAQSREFAVHGKSTGDLKLPGTATEQLEIGSAFLKVRKERAQSELALQRERERNLAAEATILAQAAEIAALQQQLADSQAAYEKDTQTLRQALQESGERERHLQELSDEAYGLLTMYGVKKI